MQLRQILNTYRDFLHIQDLVTRIPSLKRPFVDVDPHQCHVLAWISQKNWQEHQYFWVSQYNSQPQLCLKVTEWSKWGVKS